jgi:hypothetical protein
MTFQSAIALCYNQQTVALQSGIPFPQTWVVCESVVKKISPIVKGCVLNQS